MSTLPFIFLLLAIHLQNLIAQTEVQAPSPHLNYALKLFDTPAKIYCKRFSPPVAPDIHPQPIDDKFITSQCRAIRGNRHISYQLFCLSGPQESNQIISVAVNNTGDGQTYYLKPDQGKKHCFSGKVNFGKISGARTIYYEALIKTAFTYAEIKKVYPIFSENHLKLHSIKILGSKNAESFIDIYQPFYNIDFKGHRISLEQRPFGKDDHFTNTAFTHQIRLINDTDLIRVTKLTFKKF